MSAREMHAAIQVRWTGRVQGVGFRATVQRNAVGLGIHGWVRNLRDGSVEALLLGSTQAVEDLLVRVQQRHASIEQCTRTPVPQPRERLKTFEITR